MSVYNVCLKNRLYIKHERRVVTDHWSEKSHASLELVGEKSAILFLGGVPSHLLLPTVPLSPSV